MLAKDFADLVIDGLPSAIRPFVEVKVSPIAGGVVLGFSYTHSTDPADRLKARHIFMMVTGWRRDPSPLDVSARTTTSTKDAPKFRLSRGGPDKVARAIIAYFTKNQAALMANEPYSLDVASSPRRNPATSRSRTLNPMDY